ncbi:MAG: redox-regulated ATPase YchF [Armatimonadetes bacterium]|nr:redox-regulated ATPase YchF [Armatimonadota bacterium]
MVSCGLVGLPNVGKTTLFNAITRASAEVSNYPFTTIGKNEAIVPVPDCRLEELKQIAGQEEAKPATFRLVDIAGLVRGASKGEGLGNEFLSYIRNVDAIIQVLRCFEAPDISHVEGEPDPVRDLEILDLELRLADMVVLDRRLDKIGKNPSLREQKEEREALLTVFEALNTGKDLRKGAVSAECMEKARPLDLLSAKPRMLVANISEKVSNGCLEKLRAWAEEHDELLYTVPAKLAADLTELSPEEAEEFAAELEMPADALAGVLTAAYRLLDLITFYTIVGKCVTAWPIRRGTDAYHAAGMIHKDMQKGFVKAEVVSFEDLKSAGSWAHAREKGKLKLEGREYVIQDGDVLQFKFTA